MIYLTAEMDVYPSDHFDKTFEQFMIEDFFGGMSDKPIGSPVAVNVAENLSGLEFITVGMSKYLGFVHGAFIYVFGSDHVNTEEGDIVYDEMAKSIQLFEPNVKIDDIPNEDDSNGDRDDSEN